MTTTLTKTVLTAVALIAGIGLAAAQTAPSANDSVGAAPAPPEIQNAPPEKIAPPLEKSKTGAPKPAETTGGEPTAKPDLKNQTVPSKEAIPENQPSERGRLQNDTTR